jgi:hypothetical protein
MKEELYHYRVERTERGWERPLWLPAEITRKAEELAERFERVVDEFNKNTTRFKANLELRYCKPTVCEDTRAFYDTKVYERESGEQVATITYEWNMTTNVKTLVYVLADTDEHLTSLEDTLSILHLAGKLAKEFFSDKGNTPTWVTV